MVISVLDIVDLVVVLSSVWTVDADDDFLPLPAGLFTFSTVGLGLSTLPAAIGTKWGRTQSAVGARAVRGRTRARPLSLLQKQSWVFTWGTAAHETDQGLQALVQGIWGWRAKSELV